MNFDVHAHDEHTLILRQHKSVHYEAPFVFLLFGEDRALLIDTGATDSFPMRQTVDALIAQRHPEPGYRLVVVHTHAHDDHTAGDAQFADRPDTTVVAPNLDAVVSFFGFADWPSGSASLDLGGRVVDAIPGPGHQESAVVYYDRRTGLLFTGDTLYPGRLYVFDWPAYVATIDRLIEFSSANPVTQVLGCHIEMTTTPGVDYPRGTLEQPDEPPLAMTVDHLRALRTALDEIDEPGVHAYDDFIVHRFGK